MVNMLKNWMKCSVLKELKQKEELLEKREDQSNLERERQRRKKWKLKKTYTNILWIFKHKKLNKQNTGQVKPQQSILDMINF